MLTIYQEELDHLSKLLGEAIEKRDDYSKMNIVADEYYWQGRVDLLNELLNTFTFDNDLPVDEQ